MAIIYPTATKNRRMNAVRDDIDGGAGPGVLELGTAAMATILATFVLDDPCAANAVGGTITLAGLPKSVLASAAGFALEARIRDSNAVDVITGLTVGVSGSDIIVDTTTITAGGEVNLQSASLRHATGP